MAKAKDLAKLFSAIAGNDVASARSVALAIARAESDCGHHSAGRLLRGALEPNGRMDQSGSQRTVGQIGLFALGVTSALSRVESTEHLTDVVLTGALRAELTAIVREWQARHLLEKNGLKLRSKLLFWGPPGCGKSLTARALANELGLPIFVLRFDAIVGAYLGQTAQRLRELFEFAANNLCIILIDEIDALGKRRGHPMEVGELDRIVVSLLQELEHSEPKGLLIAATNAPLSLDEALWRRFDLVLEFPKPKRSQLRSFAMSRTRARGLHQSRTLNDLLKRCSTFAEAMQTIEGEQRRKILSEN
jgi:SpoVK/Ycf46/Vps4 family AAA+-type ATPase